MKYLLILAALAGGYYFYNYDDFNKPKETSPYPLFQKVANEPVTQDEVVDYALERIDEICPALDDKYDIHNCEISIANKKDFCIKMFKIDSPDYFHSKEEFKPSLRKLLRCSRDV